MHANDENVLAICCPDGVSQTSVFITLDWLLCHPSLAYSCSLLKDLRDGRALSVVQRTNELRRQLPRAIDTLVFPRGLKC
jgi:protein tyrosine phosphatase